MEFDKKIKLQHNRNILECIPEEIIIDIFQYLNGEEIKNVKLVCKQWNNLTQATNIASRLRLTIQAVSSNKPEQFKFLDSSLQRFQNLKLEKCHVICLTSVYQYVGKFVKNLRIQDSRFTSDNVLEEMLQVSQTLEDLSIVNCSFNLCSIPKYAIELNNLKRIEIVNKPATKTKYAEISNLLHNIKAKNLQSFSLNYVYKVFRSSTTPKICHLVDMISRCNLKELILNNCCFEKEDDGIQLWVSLSNNQNLNLEKLTVSHIIQNGGFEKFLNFLITQKRLKYLSLNSVRSMQDNEIDIVLNKLPSLTHLELFDCTNMNDKCIQKMLGHKNLETLNIHFSAEYIGEAKVTMTSIVKGLNAQKNQLRSLLLCNIKMEIEDLHKALEYMPQLRNLKCHSVSTVIKDESSEILKILSACKLLEILSFVNYKISRSCNDFEPKSNLSVCNTKLVSLEMSYSESCRKLLESLELPHLKDLNIFYQDDTRQKENGREFIKVLYGSAKSLETLKLTIVSDIDYILDFILEKFEKLKYLSFIWHCESCFLFNRIFIKPNQNLHRTLKISSSSNTQFDESCDQCNILFAKLKRM